MIKLENVVLASPEQMEFIIEGMRNAMNSWENSDSKIEPENIGDFGEEYGSIFKLGDNDHDLMQRLSNAGTEHRKYMRMMPVYVRITAPLYWWKEFDTYKVGTVANSCSTMHKIAEKEFTLEDFSTEHLLNINDSGASFDYSCIVRNPENKNELIEGEFVSASIECIKLTIDVLNTYRYRFLKTKNKTFWWQMIQLLPSPYNQTRNVMLNYEVLANIYRQRKNHKLDEWREVCKWIESLPYSELIIGKDGVTD